MALPVAHPLVIGFITFVLVVMLFRPAQQLEVISKLISDRDYLYRADYGALEKLVLWQKTPVHNTR